MSQTDHDIISGTFIGDGVTCPQFKLDTGEQISLSGRVPALAIGDSASLEGRWAFESKCMQGREFSVISAKD